MNSFIDVGNGFKNAVQFVSTYHETAHDFNWMYQSISTYYQSYGILNRRKKNNLFHRTVSMWHICTAYGKRPKRVDKARNRKKLFEFGILKHFQNFQKIRMAPVTSWFNRLCFYARSKKPSKFQKKEPYNSVDKKKPHYLQFQHANGANECTYISQKKNFCSTKLEPQIHHCSKCVLRERNTLISAWEKFPI